MCVPQIENVIKKRKGNLNESDKVSSNIFGYRWTEMRPRAGGRMKECVSHDAGKKSTEQASAVCEFKNAVDECNGTRLLRRAGEV